jgi:GNAT superfamily N-acetyltransferase
MSEYRIQRAWSEDDVAAMKALERQQFPQDDPPVWDKPGAQWWVVKLDDAVVAFAGGYLRESENMYYLSRSGVAPAHQGHGLQKRLIRVRIAAAKKKGAKGVFTYTRNNPPSANSLISCGFKMYHPEWRYGGKEAQYWRRMFKGDE